MKVGDVIVEDGIEFSCVEKQDSEGNKFLYWSPAADPQVQAWMADPLYANVLPYSARAVATMLQKKNRGHNPGHIGHIRCATVVDGSDLPSVSERNLNFLGKFFSWCHKKFYFRFVHGSKSKWARKYWYNKMSACYKAALAPYSGDPRFMSDDSKLNILVYDEKYEDASRLNVALDSYYNNETEPFAELMSDESIAEYFRKSIQPSDRRRRNYEIR